VEEAALQTPGVDVPETPWLGRMGPDSTGALLQVVRLDHILSEEVRRVLFKDPPAVFGR
jgi:hypothetical protein